MKQKELIIWVSIVAIMIGIIPSVAFTYANTMYMLLEVPLLLLAAWYLAHVSSK